MRPLGEFAQGAGGGAHQDEHVALLNLHMVGRPRRRPLLALPGVLGGRRREAGPHAVVSGRAQRIIV